MSKPTQAQQLMIDDGCPPSLIMSAEERHDWWEKYPPKSTPVFVPVSTPKIIDPIVAKMKEEKKIVADNKFKARIGKAKQRADHIPGSTWNPRKGRWIHPSLENKPPIINEERDMTNAQGEKTIPELTVEYNALCNSPVGKELGYKQIVKFKDRPTAVARLKKARDEIYAKANGIGTPTPKSPKAPKSPKEPKEKKRLPFGHGHADIVEAFDFRYGSEREKLLHILLENFEKMMTKEKLGKLAVNVAGITWRIDNKKLAFELRETKVDGVTSYGLYRKVHK